jgi:hypothetical protein
MPHPPIPAVTPAILTHAGNSAVTPSPRPPTLPRSYLEQLRQPSSAQVAPYVTLLRERIHRDEATSPALPASDRPLREALVRLLAHTLATGREMISGREIFWRLQVPPQREKQQGRDIARVLRSLGWVRCHYGKNTPSGRIWGWRYREWNVSASVELPSDVAPEGGPLPVFRRHRAPISIFYGDDVPVPDATPEGIWAIIRYPVGPRLKIGTPRPPAKTHRWGKPPPAGNRAAD